MFLLYEEIAVLCVWVFSVGVFLKTVAIDN